MNSDQSSQVIQAGDYLLKMILHIFQIMLIYTYLSSFHEIFDESEMSQSVSQLVSEGEGIDMNIWI